MSDDDDYFAAVDLEAICAAHASRQVGYISLSRAAA